MSQAGRFAASIGVLLLAVGGLAGCAAPVGGAATTTATTAARPSSTPSATPAATSSGTSTATPTPNLRVDPKALFTISTTATTTGSTPSRVHLVETVYGPWTSTPDSARDLALLKAQHCGALPKGSQFLTATITSKLTTGSPAWPAKDNYIGVELGDNLLVAWSGDWSGFESTCSTAIVTVPGSIHGVMVLPPVTVAGTNGLDWAKNDGAYGFGLDYDGPPPYGITYSNCTVTLGTLARANPTAQTWLPQLGTGTNKGYQCNVGHDS